MSFVRFTSIVLMSLQVNDNGIPFWSPPKRAPDALDFDIKNVRTSSLVYEYSNFWDSLSTWIILSQRQICMLSIMGFTAVLI